jgi:methionine transaminase
MSKFPNMGTTIFTEMSKLANECNAINLAQGFPNFPIDDVLLQSLNSTAGGNVHQYCPMAGKPELLEGIRNLIKSCYNRNIDPNKELLITAGATQGIFTVLQALVNRGEEVVILDPSYDCYVLPIELVGGIPKRINLNEAYLPDWEKIFQTVNEKTKVIITNNPHNPSGRIWRKSDFDNLKLLLEKHPNLIHLSDEVYEFIHFENFHQSVHHDEFLSSRSVVLSSFGKTFHITGWKVGYIVAPEFLMNEFKKVHQFLVFSVNSVAQASLADYISKVDVKILSAFYKKKRDLFSGHLGKSRFKILPSEGSYFQLLDYSSISQENDVEFSRRLTKELGVASIPVSVFNADGNDKKHIRLCFAKTDETLIQAAELLCQL